MPMSLLETVIATQLYAFLIIFARVGCVMMIMPGFSDSTVPMNMRLHLALGFTLVLVPVLLPYLPAQIPETPVAFTLLVVREMLVGIFIGLMSQVMMNAINLTGVLVSHATSLSSAFTFSPQMSSQSTVINSFLSILVVVMIFVTDMHHYLLWGVVDSYKMIGTSDALLFGDFSNTIAQGISYAFRIGLMISAPFIVVSFGVFVGMGLVARLVPQIQVFILSIPVQIITGIIVLMTAVSAMMLFYLDEYQIFWNSFISGN